MAKIEIDKIVLVTPIRNATTGETAAPFVARISDNRSVNDEGTGGWYVVEIPETGDEHEALATIVTKIPPVIVPGYNDGRERVEPVINPETGEAKYPAMSPDGYPVDSDGYVIR